VIEMRNNVILRRLSVPARASIDPDAVDLSRAVVEGCYPAELDLFDAILAQFEADPDGLLEPDRLRAPVGMGVDIALLAPYVLAAATFLSAGLAEKLADNAIDSLGQSIRDRLARRLAARRGRRGEAASEPTVESEPALTVAEMDEVTVVITVHLSGRGADPAVARNVAECVTKTLLSGKSGC